MNFFDLLLLHLPNTPDFKRGQKRTSPQHYCCGLEWRRWRDSLAMLRMALHLQNIVVLLLPSQYSLFCHSLLLASSATGGARNASSRGRSRSNLFYAKKQNHPSGGFCFWRRWRDYLATFRMALHFQNIVLLFFL